MSTTSWINIEAAFEFLLEELETELAHLERVGSRSLRAHDHDHARSLTDLATIVTALREDVRTLHRRWQERAGALAEAENCLGVAPEWRAEYRLSRAPRTPLADYVDPVLAALHTVGGTARTADFVRAAPQLLVNVLKDADQAPLAATMDTPRWRNALAWVRRDMLADGWLARAGPDDHWQASEAGLWRRECAALAHSELAEVSAPGAPGAALPGGVP